MKSLDILLEVDLECIEGENGINSNLARSVKQTAAAPIDPLYSQIAVMRMRRVQKNMASASFPTNGDERRMLAEDQKTQGWVAFNGLDKVLLHRENLIEAMPTQQIHM